MPYIGAFAIMRRHAAHAIITIDIAFHYATFATIICCRYFLRCHYVITADIFSASYFHMADYEDTLWFRYHYQLRFSLITISLMIITLTITLSLSTPARLRHY